MTTIKYRQFESQKPELAFYFLYPDEWKCREIVDSTHAEVFIALPRAERGARTVGLSVRVTPNAPQNLSDAVSAHLTRFSRLPGYRELARARGLLAGSEAVEVEIGYRMPESLDTVKVAEISVRDRRVFLEREGRLYELIYDAPEAEYETWLEVFETLARTLTFKTATVAPEFQPLVVSLAPAYGVHERRAEYKADESNE